MNPPTNHEHNWRLAAIEPRYAPGQSHFRGDLPIRRRGLFYCVRCLEWQAKDVPELDT